MNRTSLNRTVRAIGSLGIAACLAAGAVLAHGAERGPARKPATAAAAETEARVIVKFKTDSTLTRALAARTTGGPQNAQALSARLGMALRDGRELGERSQLVFASGTSSAALAARLAAQPDVEYAVVDGRQRALAAPNDPLYPAGQLTTPVVGQWYLRTPDATIVSAINAVSAWDVTAGHSSVVVAVLDTGIRPEHPDLQDKLFPGYDFIHDTPTANDGDGRDADPSDPGDGVTQADIDNKVPGCTTSDIASSSWHGTQTAGLIGAATNNGVGMASVGRDIRVLPLRVLGKCGGYDSDIQDAMRWAAGIAVAGVPANPNPAKVINLSLGSSGACTLAYQDLVSQLAAAGVLVVAAAGNEGLAVGTPANCSGVLAVAGVRHAGTKVGYSDLGPEVGIAAPAGNCVNLTGTCLFPLLTTANSGTAGPVASIYTDGGSNASIGTSFSAPLVAGAAALMLSANRGLTPAQLIAALKASARPFPTSGAPAGVTACKAPSSTAQTAECYCTTTTCGAGMLDARAAVAAVAKLTANVYAPVTATVGTGITVDGAGSVSTAAAPIVTYQWAIVGGSATAAFTSATNVPAATLVASVAGNVTVSLTVTDSANNTDTSTATLAVTDVSVTPPAATDGGGGGGGAFDPLWLVGVLLAAFVLSRSRRPARSLPLRTRQSLSRARRPSGR
jgi:serine protease